jgi:hypothetical protein
MSKKYSPQEAARMVLAKAHELYQGSVLAKAEMPASVANPDEKEDAKLGEEVERAVESHEAANPAEHREKGPYKLAKFMGRMEHKKGLKAKEMDKAETGREKGVARSVDLSGTIPRLKGVSHAGTMVRGSSGGGEKGMSDAKKESVGRMMEQSKIKPKLPG